MERSSPGKPPIALDTVRACPVCNQAGSPMFSGARELALSPVEFSPRKKPSSTPPSYHHCHGCGLAYASPTLHPSHSTYWSKRAHGGQKNLEKLAAQTYWDQAKKVGVVVKSGQTVGEWGCASGYFLALAQDRGCCVWGVEPSLASRAQASSKVRARIFPMTAPRTGKTDLIGVFQTLEHVPDPLRLLRQIRDELGEGGQVMVACHDMESWSSRLLGRKSPLYDVQHFQIFSREGIRKLLCQAGFEGVRIHRLKNRYPLSYWLELTRLSFLGRCLRWLGLNPKLSLRGGNLLVAARRPRRHGEEAEGIFTAAG